MNYLSQRNEKEKYCKRRCPRHLSTSHQMVFAGRQKDLKQFRTIFQKGVQLLIFLKPMC